MKILVILDRMEIWNILKKSGGKDSVYSIEMCRSNHENSMNLFDVKIPIKLFTKTIFFCFSICSEEATNCSVKQL